MDENAISQIKTWLATGSINIFGLPYSGKDTVGIRLAEALNGRFLSSGLILREVANDKESKKALDAGLLFPTDQFREIVLPYLGREDLADFPLILSSVGRWAGEEQDVIEAARRGGHEIKAAILLNISEADIYSRWEQAQILQDRGQRADDRDRKILATRIAEFHQKTMPVIQTYQRLGLLVPVSADAPKDDVFAEVVRKLSTFASNN